MIETQEKSKIVVAQSVALPLPCLCVAPVTLVSHPSLLSLSLSLPRSTTPPFRCSILIPVRDLVETKHDLEASLST